jgi:hypothetical protein
MGMLPYSNERLFPLFMIPPADEIEFKVRGCTPPNNEGYWNATFIISVKEYIYMLSNIIRHATAVK